MSLKPSSAFGKRPDAVEIVTLYRAVCYEELEAIRNSGGKFAQKSGCMKNKWFAVEWNDMLYWQDWFSSRHPSPCVIEIEIAQEHLSGIEFHNRLDGVGPAYCFTLRQINSLPIRRFIYHEKESVSGVNMDSL
jgi:hypothetical protein